RCRGGPPPVGGNEGPALGGRRDVQRAMVVTGNRDQLEIRQPLDQRAGHGRALPYVAQDVKGLQNAGGLVGHRQWPVEHRDLTTGRKLRPVGGLLRKMEVIVEYGDLHWSSSGGRRQGRSASIIGDNRRLVRRAPRPCSGRVLHGE